MSAVISPASTAMKLIEAAQRGEVTLMMCDALYDELQELLGREKFRRWLTLDEADDYIAAIALLAEWIPDRPPAEIPLVCDDPDDNVLVSLCQDAETNVLVSGDKAVLRIVYPNVEPRTPAQAVELLAFRHKWGDGFIPGNPEAAKLQMEAEGSSALLNVYMAFRSIFVEGADYEPDLVEYVLSTVTVPSAVQAFLDRFDEVNQLLVDRGLGTRPSFASPEVAYLKLPPNPEIHVVSLGTTPLPDETVYCTLQRCPDLPNIPELEGADFWRVFGISAEPWPLDQIPPRPRST